MLYILYFDLTRADAIFIIYVSAYKKLYRIDAFG